MTPGFTECVPLNREGRKGGGGGAAHAQPLHGVYDIYCEQKKSSLWFRGLENRGGSHAITCAPPPPAPPSRAVTDKVLICIT